MTKPDRPAPGQRYHLVGVAGVGMRALAEALLARGVAVSGSDRFFDAGEQPDVLARLTAAGIRMLPQDGTGPAAAPDAMVCSTAIEDDNPDLLAARDAGVPVLHRAEVLAGLCAGQRCIAVSGTAGKTTVTGMVGWILEQLGMDPNVVNGGALVDWRRDSRTGSTRHGGSDLWVVEADESDRSLLRFEPTWSAITNISRDHFDLDELVRLFSSFAGRTSDAVVCGPSAMDLLAGPDANRGGELKLCPVPGATVRLDAGWGFTFESRTMASPLPGRHNAENALVALALCCRAVGCGVDEASAALQSFQGIERRLQCVGQGGGVRVLDEYAHNPAKIAAAWTVAREEADRVIGVWRPHGFAPLRLMWDDLVATFAELCDSGDRLFLLPVYYAGGTAEADLSSEQLAMALRERGIPVEAVPGYSELEAAVAATVGAGDTVMIMGARDPHLPDLARNLARRFCAAPHPGSG